MSATRICLVRHGETDWNAERRFQGHLDIGLNATGLAQASGLARMLEEHCFAAVYASDLLRARQTAVAVANVLQAEVRPIPELRERHYGVFQSLTYDEAKVHHPADYRRFEGRDPDFAPQGGETLAAFADRVVRCLTRIAIDHPGEEVLVVAHGGVLDIARRAATGMSLAAPRDFTIANAALNWLEYHEGRWRLLGWGIAEADALDEI
jgi:probable phosphoglycerate mutase